MILLLLGTHEQPFERALDLTLPLADAEPLIVQHGHTSARPTGPNVEWVEFAPYEDVVDLCKASSNVITHAGVGTIMTALGTGKTPLVIPRLARFGEHVDDHQLQIATAFAARGLCVLPKEQTIAGVRDALAAAGATATRMGGNRALRRAVAEAVG